MIPEAGRRFGPYEIQAKLGGGGMGHVYSAWDARLHREVAIKLLHNEYAMPGMRERFLREARAASALNHPNICTIFDIGEQDGDPYLVMELLEGETLKERILRNTIQTEELVCIGREVAEALAAAHAKGIVHRDIKPANIFLVSKSNGRTQAKVLDFGLAKIESGSLGARSRTLDITTVGATVGTLAYMSPEQARGEVLDSRSDLFSLGVVMYEMATRHIPFPGATSALVFVKLLNQLPEPVRDWNDTIPKELERVISKLMSKERTARYQTALELDEALARLTERPNGGWLRKAVATVPLVRAPDPVARERRVPSRRRGSDSAIEPARPPGNSPVPPVQRTTSDQAQVLRPVSRLPRDESAQSTRSSGQLVTPPTPSGSLPGRRLDLATDLGEEQEAQSGETGPFPDAGARVRAIAFAPLKPSSAEARSASVSPLPEALTAGSVAAAQTFTPTAEPERQNGDYDPTQHVQAKPPARRPGRLLWVTAAALLLLGAAALVAYLHHARFGSAGLASDDLLVLTDVENKTGDKSLDGTVIAGLSLDLEESPYLRLASQDAYLAAIRLQGNRNELSDLRKAALAARRLGAKAYVYGSVQGATPPYILHVDLRSTATDDVFASVEERAAGLQEIPGAIDRLADGIRASAGEGSDSILGSHNPLAREGTGDLPALRLYTQGQSAEVDGRPSDALQFYQQTVALEPRFVQAQLRLVVMYRKSRAEVAAAEAARLALAASDTTSDRFKTLAQYEYEVNSSGDLIRATGLIRHLLAERPRDATGLADLARVLRLQGHFPEALQAAQQSSEEDPFELDAYVQAESALICLDRYEAALQIEEQVQRLGIARVAGNLVGAYLAGRQALVAKSVQSYQGKQAGQRSSWNYGLYLDNAGRLKEGLQEWQANAAALLASKGLESGAASLLAQGALDRALIGDCPTASVLVKEAAAQPRGKTALFNSAMTDALCGQPGPAREIMQQLQSAYPQSTDLNEFQFADLKAALAITANDPAAALESLQSTRQYDLISLTPLLRGRAHVALQQVQIGIVDFQTVLSHRGVTFIFGNDSYPVAEIGVARAFADTGDSGNSAEAYGKFLVLWKDADTDQPLLQEAKKQALRLPASPVNSPN